MSRLNILVITKLNEPRLFIRVHRQSTRWPRSRPSNIQRWWDWGARVRDTLEVLLLLVLGRLVALGGGLLPGLGGLVGVVIVSSRTGVLAIMVLATFDREEGVGVLGVEAEEAEGVETSMN